MTAVRVGGFEPRKRNTHGHEGHPEPSAAERAGMAAAEAIERYFPVEARAFPERVAAVQEDVARVIEGKRPRGRPRGTCS